MSRTFTGIKLHQYGLQRIDITAMIMLLIALAVVLIANKPQRNQPGIAQAGPPIVGLSTPHAIPLPTSLETTPTTSARVPGTGHKTHSPRTGDAGMTFKSGD